MEELKRLLEEQRKAFEDFKKLNDQELAELKKGRNDPVLAEAVKKANDEVGRLEKEFKAAIRELETKGARPGRAAGDEELTSEDAKAYAKAFDSFVRKGMTDGLAELQAKATTVGNDTEGGYAVTPTLDTAIEKYERDNAPMRGLCSVITVSNEAFEKLVQQGEAGSGWVDELEARGETSVPTFAALKPYFGELYANPGASQKALDDLMFNVESWLAEEVGTKFAEDENAAFTSGNGVKKPRGILGYTLAATADGTRAFNSIEYVASGTSDGFDGDDLIDLIHKLKRGYRNGASWLMSSLGVARVRKLKDATSGQYLWQPGLTAGAPDMLLGYPVEENDDWPDPAADAYAVGFGNWRRAYTVVDVRGVRMIRDVYTAKPKVLFYTTKRVGGFLVNDRALKVLKLGTS